MLTGEHAVGRVIARPFAGPTGRTCARGRRRDFSLPPLEPTVLDRLVGARPARDHGGQGGRPVRGPRRERWASTRRATTRGRTSCSTWRSGPARAWCSRTSSTSTRSTATATTRPASRGRWSVRRRARASCSAGCASDEMVWVTADHGNDPTTPEHRPLPRVHAAAGRRPARAARADLGTRSTFADLGRDAGRAVRRVAASRPARASWRRCGRDAEDLMAEAEKARRNAYSPYSRFAVGAALLTRAAAWSTAATSRTRRSAWPAAPSAPRCSRR